LIQGQNDILVISFIEKDLESKSNVKMNIFIQNGDVIKIAK